MSTNEDDGPSAVAWLAYFLFLIGAIIGLLVIHFGHYGEAQARDLGQWSATDPALRGWYESLMQPDVPTASCCGQADAYFCNNYRMEGGKALCTIDDDRPDEPRGRPHVDNGTVIEIPQNKLKWDSGNPTGNGVVFLSRNRYVFCYVQPGGA